MKKRRFDHIDLRVNDMRIARKFYGQLLPALGFSVASDDEEWSTYQGPGEGPTEFFGFTQGTDHRPNETRIAFWAESPAEVKRLAEIVRQAGGLNLEGLNVWREQTRDLPPGEPSLLRSRAVLRDVSP